MRMFKNFYSIPYARKNARNGAVIPFMAFLLPVLLLICGMAINFALMHLRTTELQVATDAAARAAGRAFSEFQTVDDAIDYAVDVGQMNKVGSDPLMIDPAAAAGEIEFGLASRLNGGLGRYDFTKQDREAVRNQTAKATAVRVTGKRTPNSIGGSLEMFFSGFGPFGEYSPELASTSTQVDRDIALVLDRSGSMLEFKDWPTMEDAIDQLYDEDRINWSQRNDAKDSIWDRAFPYYRWSNGNAYYDYFYYWHSDNSYNEELYEYAYDYHRRLGSWYPRAYNTNDPAPRHSRWDQLEDAVAAFLEVLDDTAQEELVSLITFNSSASKIRSVTSNYTNVLNDVVGVAPKHGTNISDGLSKGADSVLDHSSNPDARFYAAKTIILLTDGEHTSGGTMPAARAAEIVAANNVVIHAITFSTSVSQTSKDEMKDVADIGGGTYYHAEDGADLVRIFREIANNLPTIITQ